MKFRKNRLFLLASVVLLVKMVKEGKLVPFGKRNSKIFSMMNAKEEVARIKDKIREEYNNSTYSATFSDYDKALKEPVEDVYGNNIRIVALDRFNTQDDLVANENMEFIRIRVKFTNGSEKEMKISHNDFNIKSDSGIERKVNEGTFLDEQLVNPMESIEGILLFEVPVKAGRLNLEYAPPNALSKISIKIQ